MSEENQQRHNGAPASCVEASPCSPTSATQHSDGIATRIPEQIVNSFPGVLAIRSPLFWLRQSMDTPLGGLLQKHHPAA